MICNTSRDNSKPDGTIDYAGLYKIRPEKMGNIMPSRVHNYESCKKQALDSNRKVFGLSGFDPGSQTAFCYLDDKIDDVIQYYTGKNVFKGNDGMAYSGDRDVSAIYYVHKGRPWQCVEGVNIPIRVNDWNNLECMSANGKDCITAPNMSQCKNYTVRPVNGNAIPCNQDKYNDPSHWCSRVRDAERLPPGQFTNPNVYGNGQLPVKPVALLAQMAQILPAKKPVPTCCCPAPDPKKYMLRTDFQKLLNRKIEYHRDYKILMDQFAKQDQRGYISCTDSTVSRTIPLSSPEVVLPTKAKGIQVKAPKASSNPLCGVKCESMCCPPPDMRKYILKSEAEKILAMQKIQDHPEYKALMDTFAVKKANGEYQACRVQI